MGLGSGIDPGSGKTLFWILDPGVKKAPDSGSRIRIRNTACKLFGTLKYNAHRSFALPSGKYRESG
jgi:hypothetical protein